jgi:NTE family protein
MLRALFERDIAPDLLVGTSAGALNAAFIASRPPTVATADQLADVWCRLRREHVFPLSLRALIVGLAGRRDHLVPNGPLRRLVEEHVEFADIGHAAIPLHVVAFDVKEGREVLLSAGRAVDAITAAASIPGVFPPVPIGERSLVDGGVANNTPLSHAVALGAQRIFVLPTSDPQRPADRTSRGALHAAIDGLAVLTDARLQFDLAQYSRTAEIIMLPCPNRLHIQPTDFEHANQLIRDAFIATRALLARAQRRRSRSAQPGRRRGARRPANSAHDLSQAA